MTQINPSRVYPDPLPSRLTDFKPVRFLETVIDRKYPFQTTGLDLVTTSFHYITLRAYIKIYKIIGIKIFRSTILIKIIT